MRVKNRQMMSPCKIRKNGILVPGQIKMEIVPESQNPNNIIIKIQDSEGLNFEAYLDISGIMSLKQNIEKIYQDSNLLIYQQGRY